MAMARALRFTGGHVLGPGGLAPHPLTIEEGRFVERPSGPFREVPAEGLWLLPGIVDLHGDGFERHVAPRRGVVSDLAATLPAIEAELAASGITTAWLAQFWSWEGGMRGPDFARRFASALDAVRPGLRIDMRLQLRFEATMIADGPEVLSFVEAHGIDYVVFNDHVPHQRLAEGRTPARLAGSAIKAGRSPEAHLDVMKGLTVNLPEVPGFVRSMARELTAHGVTLGSHDDADTAARTQWGEMGLHISEFPTTRAAVEAAAARGEPVIMGAPNIVRGGSHNRGGLAAEQVVADGLVDALASDYHYPALAAAAFALSDRGILPLAQAWELISENPARLIGLPDRGSIAPGKRADLTVYDPARRRILGTFGAGRPVLLIGDLAERFSA